MSCRKKLPPCHAVVKVAMRTTKRRDACCPTISRKISLSSTPHRTDEQCQYLFRARWPDGFRCDGCGHDHAYTLRTRLVYECVACRKQHPCSPAPSSTDQDRPGALVLAVYLVTSRKGRCRRRAAAAAGLGQLPDRLELAAQAPQGHGRPERPLAGPVEADETYVGGPRPGKRGRGAAGKALSPVRRGRPSRGPTPGPAPARGGARRFGREPRRVPRRGLATAAVVATNGWAGYAGLPAEGYATSRASGASGGDAACGSSIDLVFGLAKRWLLGTDHGAVSPKHCPPTRRVRVPVRPPHRQEHQPRLRPPRRAGRPHQACYLPGHRRRDGLRLKVMERQFLKTASYALPPLSYPSSLRCLYLIADVMRRRISLRGAL